MVNFRESIDALKEAGLADSEILEIMFESVDGQIPTKNIQENKMSGLELPDTPSTRKRKSCVLSAEKHTKSATQDSPRHNSERERSPVSIFLPTEQSLLYPLAPIDSVFQPMWMKPLI